MSKESPVSAGNDAYADLDRQVYNCLYLWNSWGRWISDISEKNAVEIAYGIHW